MEEDCDMSLEFERRLAGDQKRIEEALLKGEDISRLLEEDKN